jgi:rhamnose transport system substrate-binding protein
MHLVKIAYGDDEPQKSTSETEALLSAFPRLRGILSPTAVGLPAAARVAVTQGAAGRVMVTGLGTPNQLRFYVESGAVRAFQLWDPYDEGLAAAHLADGLARGKLAATPGRSFVVPGLGRLTVRRGGVVLPREEMLTFTRRNIGGYRF